MGIFDRFGSEFVDIIEWLQSDNETVVYHFPRYRNEIKYGAKLTVHEGQVAIFVNKGKIADVFPPGTYELETANLPILSTLQNWHHGFESPFKAEVYFFNTNDFLTLKWGSQASITLTDAEFGIVRLRAFGSFTMRISDPTVFLQKLVGTDGNFEITEISEQLTNSIIARFPEVLAESDIGVLELPARYSELAQSVKQRVSPEFSEYGLEVGKIYVESVSLPENVQKALDEKNGGNPMNAIGDSSDNYATVQTLQTAQSKIDGSEDIDNSEGLDVTVEQQIEGDLRTDSPHQAHHTPSATNINGDISIAISNDANSDTSTDNKLEPLPPKLYYLMILGERNGPMTLKEVYRYLEQGDADADTLIWKKGMVEWQAIQEIPDIDLTQVPPPPPASLNL